MVGFKMDGPSRDRVMKLMDEKDRIESEIRDNTAILETNNIGMNEPLVDEDGYPRNDIDVYKVRHARHRIICLQNDHKAIMKKIEQGLLEVHSELIGSRGESVSQSQNPMSPSRHREVTSEFHTNAGTTANNVAFAKVVFVHDGSPADLAGLIAEDEILQFGSINNSNFVDMPQIYELVSHSVGQKIFVTVRRQHNIVSLSVVPRPWAQPGLLGCQINRIVD